MKNALAAGAVAIALFAASSGVALAEGINLHVGATISHEGDQNENEATSTDQDINDNENGTTTPGIERHHATNSDENASSTDRQDKQDKGGRHGNFIFTFFQWLFGLPATTTVGDIRAEINASSTASTSPSQGLGFWARFFGFFHFGK